MRRESVRMDGKGLIGALVSLIIFVIFAIIYFIILGFIVRFGAGLVAPGDVGAETVAIAAAILTAGTLIAGGSIKDAFKMN
jgi:hypothetical protein